MEEDSNLRSRRQQIYSLPPLAARESIHVYILYQIYYEKSIINLKADNRNRTDNLLITNQLLCQLSHVGNYLNGAYRARTYDPLLVRQMLSQLS